MYKGVIKSTIFSGVDFFLSKPLFNDASFGADKKTYDIEKTFTRAAKVPSFKFQIKNGNQS